MLIGMMAVRNMDWVVGLSARVALQWCDRLAVFDHASDDHTRDILADLSAQNPGRVKVLREERPSWDEMRHRQELLEAARKMGASHLAIIDADEVLSRNLSWKVLPPEPDQILQLPLYNVRGGRKYHSTGMWGNRIASVAFADDRRLCWVGDQYHHREPFGKHLKPFQPVMQGHGGIVHYWGGSERRLVAKHALYKVTERERWPAKSVAEIDAIYNQAIKGRPGTPEVPANWRYEHIPEAWAWPDLEARYLNVDAVPWQEEAVRDAIRRRGPEFFAGLDLFGLEKA